ncbi:MAG: type II CAAX endopeptidase family protein [Anaerolineales bacterium]
MNNALRESWRGTKLFRWQPSKDLLVLAISWILVVAALYSATVLIGPEAAGGMAYFGLYAVLGALIFGVGIPVFWIVIYRKRPLADLGLTTRGLTLSVTLQVVFAVIQYFSAFRGITFPDWGKLLPLIALALSIGLFEAIFWRGWVLLRLEESFGLIAALLIGSLLYAAYHVGYAMPVREMAFLFVIGLIYALVFRLTKSIFILWPLLQPMGQLVTLLEDRLTLPTLAALGFFEVLIVMWIVIWLAARYSKKAGIADQTKPTAEVPDNRQS